MVENLISIDNNTLRMLRTFLHATNFYPEDKGHDENHSQSKHSIFNHIFTDNRHYQVLVQIHYQRLANP